MQQGSSARKAWGGGGGRVLDSRPLHSALTGDTFPQLIMTVKNNLLRAGYGQSPGPGGAGLPAASRVV
jgi:hypothetical protein